MKKKLCYTSAALLVVWILGFFILELSSPVHSLLWIAIIAWIRSLFVCDGNDEVVVAKQK
jgi:hypothetical protein